MTSKLEIINLALLEIGDTKLENINETGAGAISARSFYDLVVNSIFSSEYTWRFADKKANLARSATPPLDSPESNETLGNYGFRYAYQLPADYLKVWKVNGGRHDRFEIVGDKIFTDQRELVLDYTRRTPESTWPPYFQSAVVYALAARIAMPVTENSNLRQQLEQLAEIEIKKARTTDARNRPNKVNRYSAFINARY